ncbi:hypothetical protein [Longivirga aurantiaca]|uniref:Uncharacterized protein n=1 Tax=Longivirga aurantiaca TaxID=1837743 RepID=A0ABW1SV74_9ACTN
MTMVRMTLDDDVLDAATQRKVAVALFNRVWDLLDSGDGRSAEETAEMLDAAHASRYLWRRMGGEEQAIVGEWQISRAYAAAGLGLEAVRHANVSLALLVAAEGELPDWLTASVHEGLARALLANGDGAGASAAIREAAALAARITDAEDRDLVEAQIAELISDDA